MLAVDSGLNDADNDEGHGQANYGPIGEFRVPKATVVLSALSALAACLIGGFCAVVGGLGVRRRFRWRRWGLIVSGALLLLCGTVGMIPAHNLAYRLAAQE